MKKVRTAMKMLYKLIIIFSLLAVFSTLFYSWLVYRVNISNLEQSTFTYLNTLGIKMQSEIESYIDMMDYSIKELTSHSGFMNAFNSVYNSDDAEFSSDRDAPATIMSRIMYQAPLTSRFYRTSAFCDDGFVLTSHFETLPDVNSYSEDAKQIISSFPYLDILKTNPYYHIVSGPHQDPWRYSEGELVFSVTRAVIYNGSVIGYLEVEAPLDDLANIFLVLSREGILTQAVFDDGTTLFRMMGDDETYPEMKTGVMTVYPVEDASDRWVVRQYSKSLGLNIYASQQIDALGNTMSDIMLRSLLIMLPVLAVMILLIIVISYGMTASIRRLQLKISQLPVDEFIVAPENFPVFNVVKPGSKEMYDLEQHFNRMLDNLIKSYSNEARLREGTLKAQLKALQLQINPHFVYNTLNIISAKGMESGNEEITEICEQFAQMLRYSTDVRSDTATLREELENVRRYLNLCKARYEDQLEYDILVPEEVVNIELPKLTLQPIVENSLKFGFRSAYEPLRIIISAKLEEECLIMEIRDNGNGFAPEILENLKHVFRMIEDYEDIRNNGPEEHIGLINTYRRLFYYSRGSCRMDIYNDGGAVVQFRQFLNTDNQ